MKECKSVSEEFDTPQLCEISIAAFLPAARIVRCLKFASLGSEFRRNVISLHAYALAAYSSSADEKTTIVMRFDATTRMT